MRSDSAGTAARRRVRHVRRATGRRGQLRRHAGAGAPRPARAGAVLRDGRPVPVDPARAGHHLLARLGDARLSGQPGGEHRGYYEHVRGHIFRPAGTTRSDFFTAPQWRADRRIAHPYVPDENGEPVDVIDDRQTFVGTPAGGSFGTVGDLVRIVRALQRGRLLDPVYAQLASSPKVPRAQSAEEAGTGRPMGFGNYLTVGSLRNNQWVLGHGGGAPGVSAHVQWFPDSGWVTAVLGNYHRAAEPVAERARELIVG
ncbi:serine hydrolase domain-containing protein [Plantactinospora sp. KLBMP9567]|uniref:serine hydrolase domain-containing protein n=1 Tax=Plantactinospora sp. KLBMP9567 TaxID=3085900 RepID=UPI002981B092|nr:serine hydrolase domain-containing protein [Plantactinospora sp. KLBMP9567]MDW5323162.1 serine hydrolase domain-containing protein [Plantactinospora sp. KLBMP9567]